MSRDTDNLVASRSEKQPRLPGALGIWTPGSAAAEDRRVSMQREALPDVTSPDAARELARLNQRAFYIFIGGGLLLGILIVLARYFGRGL